MRVSIEQIEKSHDEQVVIKCYKVNDEVLSIVNFVKSTNSILAGYIDDRMSQIYLHEIFYVEAVDNRVFAYTKKETYEIKYKLYEFENLYIRKHFFRCSKSLVVNLMKIDNVRPILNGRFSAKLLNGEEIIISRQYASEFKNALLGGQV